jgi:hypothetical protein
MGLIIGTDGAGFPPRGDKGSFKLPFQEQIDFFNQKNPLPSQHYDDILKAAHDKAFIVAGAAKADLVNDFYNAVGKAAKEGKTIDWFRKEFDNIVKKHGWTGWTGEGSAAGVAWRTRVIYQTNLSTSYAAGRWAQLHDPDLLAVRPYWKYIHNDTVAHPRELHQSWNGTVLPHDHPWWATHFAPNGWGCRCRIMAVRAKEYKGHPAPNDGTYQFTDRNGVSHTLPKGVDYGFDYAPGASTAQSLTAFVNNKITNYPAELGKALQASVSKLFKKESTVATDSLALAKQTAVNYVLENGKKFAAKNVEFAYIYDESGDKLFTKQGKESAVGFTTQELSAMRLAKNAVVVHNHPSGGSLSDADFRLQHDLALKEVVAAGHNGVIYSGLVINRTSFDKVHNVVHSYVEKEFTRLVESGELSALDAEMLHFHIVNQILANASIIHYEVSNSQLLPEAAMLNDFIHRIANTINKPS